MPTLHRGDVVVLDNLAVHKQPAVQAAIERVGARLRFLRPCSPDFNPIEQAFAKLKAFLRAARPRTFDQVVALVAIALELFSPPECLNFSSEAEPACSLVRGAASVGFARSGTADPTSSRRIGRQPRTKQKLLPSAVIPLCTTQRTTQRV